MLDLSLGTFTHKAPLALVPYSACHKDEQLPPDDNLPWFYDKEYCVMEVLEAKFSSIPGNVLQKCNYSNQTFTARCYNNLCFKRNQKNHKSISPSWFHTYTCYTAYYLLAGYLHY